MSHLVDLTQFINKLRRRHGVMSVAILSGEDFRFLLATAAGTHGLTLTQLPDGRAALSTSCYPFEVEEYLSERRVAAESWIELREYDDRYEEVIYVGNVSGRYVRVQTGMLDELFGYVAVQTSNHANIDEAIEDIQLRTMSEFEAKYERLAAAPIMV